MSAASAPNSRAVRLASLVPWIVWALMSVALAWFVFAHASRFPFADDVDLFAPQYYGLEVDGEWLWSPHNDHRLPLVRLCELGALELGGDDFRAPLVLHVASLSLLSAALILVARRLRGRPSVADAFFPLLWMSWGNAENLLWSHQLQMTFTSALAVCAAMALTWAKVGRGALALAGLCSFALPLCGGGGVAQAPVLAVLLAWTGLERARTDRVAARIALVGALATLALCAWYFVDLGRSPANVQPSSASELAWGCVGFASMTTGALPWRGWELVGGAVLALAIFTLARELRWLRSDPVRRALTFVLLAQLALVVALASSRSDPQSHLRAIRYVSLLYPLPTAAFLLWARTPLRVRVMEYALCAAMLAALWASWPAAIALGRERRSYDQRILSAVREGLSSADIARDVRDFFPGETRRYTRALATMRKFRMGPFRDVTWPEEVENEILSDYSGLVTQPMAAVPREQVRERVLAGRRIVYGPPPTKLVYAGPSQPAHLSGEFGVGLALSAEDRKALRDARGSKEPDVAFVVELFHANGTREELLRRELRATPKSAERLLDLDLAIPAGCARIELRFDALNTSRPEGVLAYWHKLELRP